MHGLIDRCEVRMSSGSEGKPGDALRFCHSVRHFSDSMVDTRITSTPVGAG